MTGRSSDDGLAPERTGLAWTRSLVLVAAAAGSVAKAAISDGRPLLGTLVAFGLLVACGLLTLRGAVLDQRGAVGPDARRRDRAALTGVALATAVAALVVSATLVP